LIVVKDNPDGDEMAWRIITIEIDTTEEIITEIH
jgi:hypothetical protein